MKALFLFILFISAVFASDKSLATKIYLSLAKDICEKSVPKFYLHGNIKHLRDNKDIQTVKKCEDADIIILNTLKGLPEACHKGLLFTTKYRTYLKYPNVLGAFFWQKGRPNIIFRESSLKKNNVHLEPSFSKYIR